MRDRGRSRFECRGHLLQKPSCVLWFLNNKIRLRSGAPWGPIKVKDPTQWFLWARVGSYTYKDPTHRGPMG
jgi:hypothetical protein